MGVGAVLLSVWERNAGLMTGQKSRKSLIHSLEQESKKKQHSEYCGSSTLVSLALQVQQVQKFHKKMERTFLKISEKHKKNLLKAFFLKLKKDFRKSEKQEQKILIFKLLSFTASISATL